MSSQYKETFAEITKGLGYFFKACSLVFVAVVIVILIAFGIAGFWLK